MKSRLSGIYLLLDGETMPDLHATLGDALRGGIRIFQYREKRGPDVELLRSLHARARAAGALLLINDDIELAELVDGIHIGQDDLKLYPSIDLRTRFPDKIIGVSAHSIEQATIADYADYIGVGPLRETTTKAVTREPLGINGIGRIVASVSLPVCAIGGIRISDIPDLQAHGVAMAAIIGAVAHAEDQYAASCALVKAWNAS